MISFEELRKVAQELGTQSRWPIGEKMSDQELREMIHGANKKDKYGTVTRQEFFQILNKSNI